MVETQMRIMFQLKCIKGPNSVNVKSKCFKSYIGGCYLQAITTL
jgi:hypothetical protein